MDLIDALLAGPKAVGSVLAGPVPEGREPLTPGEMAGRSTINLLAFASGGLGGLAKAYEFNAGIDAQNSPEARAKRQVAETQLEAMNDPKRGRLNAQRLAGVTPALEDQLAESQQALEALNVQAGKQGLKFTFNNGQLAVSGEDLPGDEQFYQDIEKAQADAAAANAAFERIGSSQRSMVIPRTAGGYQVRSFDIPLYSAATREAVGQLGEFNAVSPGLDALLGGGTRPGSAGLPPPPVDAGTVPSPGSPRPPVDMSRGAAGARADLATQAAEKASGRKARDVEQNRLADLNAKLGVVDSIVTQLTPLVDALSTSPAGAMGLGAMTAHVPGSQNIPGLKDAAQVQREGDAMIGQFSRALGGEMGVLTDQDIGRMRAMLPSAYDTQETAREKITRIQEYAHERVRAASDGAKMMGGGKAAQPTGPRSRAIISY